MRMMAGRPGMIALVLATAALVGMGEAGAQIPDKFTNLKVLPKEISKAELMDVMKGFSSGLGVRCTYCHVGEEKAGAPPFQDFKFDADDKGPKVAARAMVKMVSDVNGKYLAEVKTGRDRKVEVTCMTCHRGVAVPQPIGQIVQDTLRDKGLDAAIARYRDLRKQYEGTMAYEFGERPLLDLAQTLAADKKLDDAIALVNLDAEFQPRSARVYFTLGELSMSKGDKAAAAEAFRKALEINPTLEPAKKRLAEATRAGS